MNKNIERVIAAAQHQLGVKEMPPNSNRVFFNSLYYGREVSGPAYPWCVVFIWYLFQKTKMPELFYGGGKTASCSTLYTYHKKHGQTVKPDDVKPGDLVLFDFSGRRKATQHIGLCVYRYADNVVTIDGNTGTESEANGGAVMQRTRNIKYVSAVIRPEYPEEDEDMTQEQFDAMLENWLSRQEDKEPAGWSKDAREWAEDKKVIVGGANGKKMYNSFCTREQLVAMLYRAMNNE